MLASHPNQQFAAFLRCSIEQGFRIRVPPSRVLHTRSTHLPSAASHSELIFHRIAEVVMAGTLATPPPGSPPVHLSPIGIIPKPHQPGKFRLIVDLSLPHGASINEAIPPELASLHYPRVDQTAALIAQHGWGTLIAKLDLHSAYRDSSAP